ncbi:hypothetical protein [Aliamphritea spongicola]|nr:hypothetical protein [Aliamphritea spongicola]
MNATDSPLDKPAGPASSDASNSASAEHDTPLVEQRTFGIYWLLLAVAAALLILLPEEANGSTPNGAGIPNR